MGHISEKLRLVTVSGLDLAALVFDLPEQTRVLNSQSGLGRESLQEIDDFRRKAARLLAPHGQRPHDASLPKKWNRQNRSIPKLCKQRANLTTSVFLLV